MYENGCTLERICMLFFFFLFQKGSRMYEKGVIFLDSNVVYQANNSDIMETLTRDIWMSGLLKYRRTHRKDINKIIRLRFKKKWL